jgi:hypothetical protein
VEKLLPLSLEQVTVRQAVDSSALETSPIVPLAIVHRSNGSLDRSNSRDSTFRSSNRGRRDVVCVAEAQGQERKGFFRKLLEIFGVWVDWACRSKRNLDRFFPVGLKRFLGSRGLGRDFKRAYFVLRGARLWAGSRKCGFRPNVKNANKSALDPGSSSYSFSTGVGFDLSGQGVSLPSTTSSSVPEAVGSSGRSSGAPMTSSAVVEPLPVGFDLVGSGFSSQLASSSRVSSPVSPNSAGGASGLAGSLSKLGEVCYIGSNTFIGLSPLFSGVNEPGPWFTCPRPSFCL